jgi:TfoX/Sxy family transcriptional regulator of competence genes
MPMKSTPGLIERVRAELSEVSSVAEKRMFGSTGFMIQGKLAIAARPERIMCRIDPGLFPAILKKDGCRPVVMKGRTMKGYVYVDADSVATRRALSSWVRLVLTQNKAITE